jgi:hypothetical protein
MQTGGSQPPAWRRRLRKWGIVLIGVLALSAIVNLLPRSETKPKTGSQQGNGSREPPDVTAFSVIRDDINNYVILPIRVAWTVLPMIKESLDRGTGIYRSREELVEDYKSGNVLWKWIDKPERVVQIAHESLVEPFPPRALAALEKAFTDAKEPVVRLHAATLLARYRHKLAEDHLRLVSIKGAPPNLALSAATTLALNRDTNSLSAILSLLNGAYPENSDLAAALGNWPDPRVIEALARRVATDKIRSHDYAFALAKLGHDGGRAAFQHKIDWRAKEDARTARSPRDYVSRTNSNIIRVGGLNEEASAARIGMISTNVFLEHAEEIYQKGFSYDNSKYVMMGFDLLGAPISTPPLLRYLQDYSPRHQAFLAWTNPPPAVLVPGQRPPPTPYPPYPPVGFMAGAARLLSEWEIKEAVPYLKEIIPTIQLNRPRWSQKVAGDALNQQLGLALYKLDPDGWKETLVAARIPPELIESIPEIARLRPVAPGCLPKQGRLGSR